MALYPWELLAEDVNVSPQGEGFSEITFAHNVREKAEVSQILAKAEKLGGVILKPAQNVLWGGDSGYFKDLDGHLCGVAWNPFSLIKENGSLEISKDIG